MKTIIYLSGICGFFLLTCGLLGVFLEFSFNRTLLITGLILVFIVFWPLFMIEKLRQDKKIDQIIESYRGKKKKSTQLTKEKTKFKGWNMNNSPFRERKSGLSWGGGNIKGANATRETRKSFFK